MDRTERFYKMIRLLEIRRSVSRRDFLEELEVSPATFKRDLKYLCDRLNAPIVWDRRLNSYRLNAADPRAPKFALPGLWFNASEAHALLAIQSLLDNLQPGLLAPHIAPLQTRIEALLGKGDHAAAEVHKRIRLLRQASRNVVPQHFETVSHAVLARKRLNILHYNRTRNEEIEREVSPQRLVHYRDNWYLDAWCHLREGLRCFALESIRRATLLDTAARNISEAVLNEELGSSYGIFTGKADKVAKLRFTPERARWVAGETWHPQQKAGFDKEGYYLLEVPYREDQELVMDILKHGPEVEVLAPKALREKISQLHEEAARKD
ncbi:MAG: helix-turn-helix transcriptional regulator [Sulfuricaulis sp.]